jgi:hypothetical protein
MHTAELLGPESSPFEAEIAIGNLERYKSSGINQVLVEII